MLACPRPAGAATAVTLHPMASTSLSPDLRAWAQAAGYTSLGDEADTNELRPLNGANIRYHLRPHDNQRTILARTEPDSDPDEHIVLLIASPKVVEHHLYSLFGDDIRDDLALPYLQLPWATGDLAPGYTLGTDAEESQVLVHHSRGAVATAPDPDFALLTLVPLSHLLGFSAADLRRAFMAEDGAPLLSNGYYAPR
ncbi:hypothetical protein EXE63_00195 (plasmid) [Mycolicibacterium frederiksbergense]|uniref:Uncharacterized protein n=2 Tax=Mycolicibacterium frederiksbergense TaxID=117567 RepID=A0A6H0RWL0_9MYCO|nr:hypothetical protein EXE63_00195 [Mycolicibacterium frederiksbergense]